MDDETLTTRCYDTEAQLETAEASIGLAPGAGSDGVVASAARKLLGRHRHGRVANHTGTSGPLSLWGDSPPGGWRIDTYSSCTWFNLTGSYDNATSYMATGVHTAQLSIYSGGAGGRLQGAVNSSYDLPYWGFNDTASARARGGIGCGIP